MKSSRTRDMAQMQVDLVVVDDAGKQVLHKAFPVEIPEALMQGGYKLSILLNPRVEAAAAVRQYQQQEMQPVPSWKLPS